MQKTSIIVSCFNNSRTATHMSMLCLDHIRKFTDEDEYELIIIDPVSKFPIRNDYNTLFPEHLENETKWLKLASDPGYTAGMNLGAKHAKGEILVFIQNDVFVREGWLRDLRWYIENGWDVVYPDQVPRSRQYVLESYSRPYAAKETREGGRDAGLVMIKKEAFEKMGGWNEKLGILAERDFYERIDQAGLKWTDTNKTFITHIMASTNLQLLDNDPQEYDKRMKHDADILNKK